MPKRITQRELRNGSGEIMRALDRGESFVVTRNGAPVGELVPLRRRQFVTAEATAAAFSGAPGSPPSSSETTSTPSWTRTPSRMPERRHARGRIDTSVVIDLDRDELPEELAISAVTLAELAAGPHATTDAEERARRQDRRQRTEATFGPLPLDAAAARAFGRIYAGRRRRRQGTTGLAGA